MSTTTQTDIKQQLLRECIRIQQEQINTARNAMNEAQESANEEAGSMEDKFESFREAMQIQRDMFARQMNEAVSSMAILKRIVSTRIQKDIALGSVINTDSQKFFVALSLGEIAVEGEKYFAISAQSPLFKAMVGKTAGQSFVFRDRNYKIDNIF